MPVIAVINRKGGSGKSTLATHLAAYCALTGKKVMLGDVDRQQSAQTWLRLRGAQKLPAQAAIQGWTLDPKNVLRAPAGVTHMVLDTPGGMRGFELARIVMAADVILMPVCNSVFDRESAAECFAELKAMPRVATGRCKVAAIGMRLDARTKANEVLAEWAGKLDLPFIGVLRETQAYVRCIEVGLTLFDLPRAQAQADLAQWKPVLGWMEDALRAQDAAPVQKAQAPAETAAPRTVPSQSPAATPTPQASRAPAAHVPPSLARESKAPAVPATLDARAALAADAATRPVPSRLLANEFKPSPPTLTLTPHTAAVAAAGTPRTPRIDRAPEGELAHAGTLASIGELARALKANETNGRAPVNGAAGFPGAQGSPGAHGARAQRAGSGADAGADAAVPLRPSRPIIPPSKPVAPRTDAALKPAQTTAATKPTDKPLAPAARPAAQPRPAVTAAAPARSALSSRIGQLLDTLPLVRFLQRNS